MNAAEQFPAPDSKSSPDSPVVCITGAAAGIGRACAEWFAEVGHRVALLDRDEARVNDVCERINADGGSALALTTDISDEERVHESVARILDRWGRIDSLVANAGVQIGGTLLDTSDSDWERILAINLNGTAYACKAVIPAMLEQKAGSIVIVSSVNALVGTTGMTIYDMSKAAVLGLTRSLATEYGPQGIRVNAVCPGNTLTDFHINGMAKKGYSVEDIRQMTQGYGLLGRIAEPHEIAQAIAFLAGDSASFITGQVLAVDGGFSVTGRAGA